MTKFIVILVGFFSVGSYAQAPKQVEPSSVKPDILKENKKVKFQEQNHDNFMVNLTIDNVVNNQSDSFYKSGTFNPNLGFYFLYDLPLGATGFSLAPGIGFTFSKVGLDNSILSQDSMGTTFTSVKNNAFYKSNPNAKYESSSFYNSWIEVPVELRYQSKPINGRSAIQVAVGFRAGLRLAANSKTSYYDTYLLREVDMKTSPYSDLASFRYGATFRIGYGAFSLFGYYGMNQLIKDNRNYNNLDLKQYSIGLSFATSSPRMEPKKR